MFCFGVRGWAARQIENLKNEFELYKKELTGEMRFLQAELYGAKIEIEDYKKRTEELEDKVEKQRLTIDQLDKMLDEKILDNEMQKASPTLKASEKIVAPKENFDLSQNQLEVVSKYGCIGHYLDNDQADSDYGGLNRTDKRCFALLVIAIKNGLNQFTLKFGDRSEELTVGNAKLIFSTERIEFGNGNWSKLIQQLSITLDGRPVRFKASCQVMDVRAGFEKKKYEFTEANSDGLYEQVIYPSDWESTEGNKIYSQKDLQDLFTRFHVTIIN